MYFVIASYDNYMGIGTSTQNTLPKIGKAFENATNHLLSLLGDYDTANITITYKFIEGNELVSEEMSCENFK